MHASDTQDGFRILSGYDNGHVVISDFSDIRKKIIPNLDNLSHDQSVELCKAFYRETNQEKLLKKITNILETR